MNVIVGSCLLTRVCGAARVADGCITCYLAVMTTLDAEREETFNNIRNRTIQMLTYKTSG